MKYFGIFFINFLLLTCNIYSQTLDEAKRLYSEGKYAAALPAFETACKATPQNASYNQCYGNCLLETGKTEEAAPYLKLAASKNVVEAYNSLGKMHFLLYEFEESAEAYETYMQLLIKNKNLAEADLVKPLLERSERAARMLSRCENIRIIDSLIIDKKKFLDAYFIGREAGHLEASDKGVFYENPLHDKRYFARKNKFGRYRIYNETKLQDQWTDEKALALPSDSLADDNYPFVLQDGLTIYYASTGNGSIGGYDLFVSRYNSGNDTYLTPSQMGMPFNSIANDYLMAVDEDNAIGYFASDRFQPEGKVVVYTFIPNEEIQSIETENKKELINRAKISSIRDTWKKGENYSAYIGNVRKNILEEQNKKEKDFFFVINDNIVYYTLSDFENNAAKQAFLKAQELENQIKTQENDLEELRNKYGKGTAQYKKSVQSTILYRETHLPELREQCDKAMTNARNLEIKHLRQNKN